ncbi:hypothetical protein QSH57_004169 [Fusarium oxysporum f. sp. vasinfectum]|nr:hypothetical protein QSH57_004169 [Fusarium oxysporum f. sp. vasinfectum]
MPIIAVVLAERCSGGMLVEVAVPKTYPLFNLEGDDLCDIPALFGVDLVAKSYSNNQSNNDEMPPANNLQNPLA